MAWLRLFRRVEVAGDSMAPALAAGDRVLVVPAFRPRVGDVVAARDPRLPDRILLKRVAGVGPGGVTLLGDNPGASTDSRAFGPVAAADILGRAVYRYQPLDRAGRIGRMRET